MFLLKSSILPQIMILMKLQCFSVEMRNSNASHDFCSFQLVHWDYTAKKVLTLEYVPGFHHEP